MVCGCFLQTCQVPTVNFKRETRLWLVRLHSWLVLPRLRASLSCTHGSFQPDIIVRTDAPDLLGYELGDAVILVGDERFRGSELLFQPHLIGMEAGRGVAFFFWRVESFTNGFFICGFEYVTGMVLNFWFRTMAAWWTCTRIQYTLVHVLLWRA